MLSKSYKKTNWSNMVDIKNLITNLKIDKNNSEYNNSNNRSDNQPTKRKDNSKSTYICFD